MKYSTEQIAAAGRAVDRATWQGHGYALHFGDDIDVTDLNYSDPAPAGHLACPSWLAGATFKHWATICNALANALTADLFDGTPPAPRATYRDRRAARADRLRGWADKRDEKAGSAYQTAQAKADMIPFGQPILVGHYSEGRDRRYRDSIGRGFDKSHEHATKAKEMRSKAANIDAAAAHAIYSDDPDAVERLTEKLAVLEAERERVKAYNRSCRKGAPDLALLDERQRSAILSVARVGHARPDGSFPAYHLSNLGGVISTTRKRLASMV